MIRRLEKKVINGFVSILSFSVEKRMAENGGYDLSDPFIDDGDLAKQSTALNIPEPPPFQVIRYNPEEAVEVEESTAPEPNSDSTRRSSFERSH